MKFIIAVLLLTVGAFAQNTKYPICDWHNIIKNGKCIELNAYNDTIALYQIKNSQMHGEVIHRINGAEFTSIYKNGSRINNKYTFALGIPSDVYEYSYIYIDSISSVYSSDNGELSWEVGYYKGKQIVEVCYESHNEEIYISHVGINSDSYKIYYKSYEFSYNSGIHQRLTQIFDYSKCNVTDYEYGTIKSIRSMNVASIGCYRQPIQVDTLSDTVYIEKTEINESVELSDTTYSYICKYNNGWKCKKLRIATTTDFFDNDPLDILH